MRKGFLLAVMPLALLVMIFGVQESLAVRLSLKRVVFEGAHRADVLTLVNDTAEEQTYRLSWREMRMIAAEDALAIIPEGEGDPLLKPARDLVVFSPKRVTIPAGGSQQIRLMLRKPADLPDGEYRSHLYVMPEKAAVREGDGNTGQANQTTIALKMMAGVSFPVIVRQGNLSSAARFEDVRLTRQGGNLSLSLLLNRQGQRSLYGDIMLYCPGRESPVYQMRGIAVYAELDSRPLHLTFPEPAASCHEYRVVYRSLQNDPFFRGKIIAESVTSLQ